MKFDYVLDQLTASAETQLVINTLCEFKCTSMEPSNPQTETEVEQSLLENLQSNWEFTKLSFPFQFLEFLNRRKHIS